MSRQRDESLRPCDGCPGGRIPDDGDDDALPPSRRDFLNVLIAASGAAVGGSVLYPTGRYLVPPEGQGEAETAEVTLPLGPGDLKANSGRIFKFGSEPGILVRTPDGELRAFSAVCTHLACIVQYRDDLQHIWCACHNGHYDLQGRNIKGPPPRPLGEFAVHVTEDEIVVKRRG